jgi:NAD(P)-dependent dehydrogenase (short-subunit alcohol dehydrogenase family)
LQVNLKSVYLTTRFACKALPANKGCMLNTASMMGLIYAPLGIRVNAICPAGVWTPMLREWASEQAELHAIEDYLDRIHALGYCPTPDVIADPAVFRCPTKPRSSPGAFCRSAAAPNSDTGDRRVETG